MTTDGNGNGGTFTQKEMLVRMDGKLDVVIAKQNHYDVELALVKARQDEHERTFEDKVKDSEAWREEVRQAIHKIEEQQQNISAKQKATAIIVAGIVILMNILVPLVTRLFAP